MSKTVLQAGQTVISQIFKGYGTICEGPNRRGQFLVELGSVKIWVDAGNLRLASGKHKAKPQGVRIAQTSKEVRRIDLHGLAVEEALNTLERTLDKAILAEFERLEVIHGLGSGKLKQAIHKYLSNSSSISHFKLDEQNPGLTLVYL